MIEDQAAATARLPNLVIIGVSKAGTTSLFEYLGRHPAVGLSDLKELRYFTPLRYGDELGPLDEYTRHFSHCTIEQYAVEATPGYFYGGATVASAMRTTCPSLRVVLSLREPVDRCWSWFRFVKSRMRIPKDLTFEQYVDRCEHLHQTHTDGTVDNQAYWGLGGGCYAEWMDAWIKEFGDDLHVVFFDDIVADPRAVMDGLFDWLDLDKDEGQTGALEPENKTEQYRNRSAQKVAVALNRRGERFFRRHPTLKRRLRSGYYAINKAEPRDQITASTRERLYTFYRPSNERLAAQLDPLGLRLPPGWS